MGALKTTLIIIATLLIIGGATILYLLSPSKTVAATLYIRQGIAEIKSDGEWVTAQNGMELKLGDSIRTLNNSLASIIFYDSSVVRLESNTEVNIQELISNKNTTTISLKQQTGEIWSKVLKLAGMETDLNIETPTTVATVRGTAFGVVIEGNSTEVVVAEGKVGVKPYQIKVGIKKFLAEQEIGANEQATILKDKLSKINKSTIKEKYKSWIRKHKLRDKEFIKELKIKEVYKYRKIIALAKKRFGVTDEQIKDYIIKYRSREEEKRELAKYPIIPDKLIKRLDELNKELQRLESEQ